MPDADLMAEFRQKHDEWDTLGQTLAAMAERLALETIVDVLPNAASVELFGEFNEDWLRILRIRHVRSSTGDVLFDVAEGHEDPRVEAAVDEANYEYLDLLLDLTGDLHMGRSCIP